MTESVANLAERLPAGPVDTDALFDIFVEWTAELGFELYPAQEEAILEIFDGNHVVLNTPTGSGKSLVALAMHFYSFAAGKTSYYTSPIKALVSEKFFDLCSFFGAENVGMFTGDASINRGARIICCTAEILAATALTDGANARVDHAVMDEFHYYGDRERGMAWQLPLLTLPNTTFLLMSATLGDTRELIERLEQRTGRSCALVRSTERPVPLEFEYSMTPIHERLEDLVVDRLYPVYVVSFTQRECAQLAQSLTSINFCTKEEKLAIRADLKEAKFDTPYGKVIRKYLEHGIAVHHGGLLPKYRRLVERLAQKGLLKVIAGTDTLGVGINLPLRTVLFTKLCKYDGEKVRLLKVRDFQQIAGRAGRKGYDDKGLVVCQAPEHVIENAKAQAKAASNPKKKKLKGKKPPDRGYVHWDEQTFERLAHGDPEPLSSRFTVTHAMLLSLLQRDNADEHGYRALIDLIALAHAKDAKRSRLRRKARMLFQSLREAAILEVVPKERARGQTVRLAQDLQSDFSIHHALSLFLVDVAARLNPDDAQFHVLLLTFVESILEDPNVVLMRQRAKARDIAYAAMKAEGIEYDERQNKLEEITAPRPDADLVLGAFQHFAKSHPWVGSFEPRPKSVARDMYERYASFNEYVKRFGLERSEGVLLRHLSQTYKTLRQNVPEHLKTDGVYDVTAYLREVLAVADSSLVREWEQMQGLGASESSEEQGPPPAMDADRKAFVARVRAELRSLVSALASDDLEHAAGLVRQAPGAMWNPMTLQTALEPFFEEYDRLVFDHAARAADLFRIVRTGPGLYEVTQVLCDPEGHNEWYLRGRVEVPAPGADETPRLFILEALGS